MREDSDNIWVSCRTVLRLEGWNRPKHVLTFVLVHVRVKDHMLGEQYGEQDGQRWFGSSFLLSKIRNNYDSRSIVVAKRTFRDESEGRT